MKAESFRASKLRQARKLMRFTYPTYNRRVGVGDIRAKSLAKNERSFYFCSLSFARELTKPNWKRTPGSKFVEFLRVAVTAPFSRASRAAWNEMMKKKNKERNCRLLLNQWENKIERSFSHFKRDSKLG